MSREHLLGPIGNLQVIPEPQANMPAPLARLGGTHQLLSGARRKDTIGFKRSWQLQWVYLTAAEYGLLESLYLGAHGSPLYYQEPKRNLLSPDQSTGSDLSLSTVNFSVLGEGTITSTSQANYQHLGARAIRYDSGGVLTTTGRGPLTGNANTDFAPVAPGLTYTASIYVRRTSSPDVPVDVTTRIRWYDAAGTQLSLNAGAVVVPSFSFSQRPEVTAVAPAGAVGARVQLANNNLPAAAFNFIGDSWQLEQSDTASGWHPGNGPTKVLFTDLSVSVPILGSHNATATLEEA